MLTVTPTIAIPEHALSERFVRASGPGGQNVNKVATAVELRLDVAAAALPEDVKARLIALAGKRISADAVLLIDSRAFRTQAQNRAAARERLAELVARAAKRPKSRRKTRPSKAARERRLESKVAALPRQGAARPRAGRRLADARHGALRSRPGRRGRPDPPRARSRRRARRVDRARRADHRTRQGRPREVSPDNEPGGARPALLSARGRWPGLLLPSRRHARRRAALGARTARPRLIVVKAADAATWEHAPAFAAPVEVRNGHAGVRFVLSAGEWDVAILVPGFAPAFSSKIAARAPTFTAGPAALKRAGATQGADPERAHGQGARAVVRLGLADGAITRGRGDPVLQDAPDRGGRRRARLRQPPRRRAGSCASKFPAAASANPSPCSSPAASRTSATSPSRISGPFG